MSVDDDFLSEDRTLLPEDRPLFVGCVSSDCYAVVLGPFWSLATAKTEASLECPSAHIIGRRVGSSTRVHQASVTAQRAMSPTELTRHLTWHARVGTAQRRRASEEERRLRRAAHGMTQAEGWGHLHGGETG